MIHQNSLDAYHNLNRHRVNSQIAKILSLIQASEIPLNDRRIAQKTGYPLNIVESRCSQLEREGAITRTDVLDRATGNISRTWKVKIEPCLNIKPFAPFYGVRCNKPEGHISKHSGYKMSGEVIEW